MASSSPQGADTLTLDLLKSGENSTIFAYEAFSLKTISSNPVTSNGTLHSWLDSYGLVSNGDYEAADLLDSDSDGTSNWEEFVAGTAPTDSTSTFAVSASSDGTNLTLEWSPVTGKTYDIQSSTDLGANSPWEIHQANVPFPPDQDVSIAIPIDTEDKKFYRVSVK